MPRTKKEQVVFNGTGRRKSSIARVRLMSGKGNITVNGQKLEEYFGEETLRVIVKQPLTATNTLDKFDVIATVKGGGFSGQAGAVRHDIARALNAAKEAIGSGNTESISEQDFQQYFLEELRNEEIQTTTNEKTINAVKVDNKWKIVSDDNLVSAILPGLEEAINTLS